MVETTLQGYPNSNSKSECNIQIMTKLTKLIRNKLLWSQRINGHNKVSSKDSILPKQLTYRWRSIRSIKLITSKILITTRWSLKPTFMVEPWKQIRNCNVKCRVKIIRWSVHISIGTIIKKLVLASNKWLASTLVMALSIINDMNQMTLPLLNSSGIPIKWSSGEQYMDKLSTTILNKTTTFFKRS